MSQAKTPVASQSDEAALVEEELLRCSQCGLCLSNCPTYRAALSERHVARGRNWLARLVWEGRAELDAPIAEPLFQCLLCGACTVTCRSNVHTDEVMVATRHRLWQERGRPGFMRLFFDVLLPNPRLLRRLVQLVSYGKRSGLASLARRLGLLRWINARLETAEQLVETMPRSFLRDRLVRMGFRREGEAQPPRFVWPAAGTATVAYFIGCGTNFQLPEAGQAALHVLHAAGVDIMVVEHLCCGLPAYAYGDVEAARAMARRNLEVLSSLGADYVVSECASCSSFLKSYVKLLGDEAQSLAEKVRDFTEIACELAPPLRRTEISVTYHDPCHLVRGQGVTQAPRDLLRRLTSRYVELPEADWCCGGAGTYNIAHPDLSLGVLERKMTNVARTGAPVVATACPACIVQLRYGARRFGVNVQVRHISELLAEALAASRVSDGA
ncbi:MAG: (Fe-S)-binding protein [Armatimonadetes bacterium]|nr:(Fe-S)-binding protein [Armatimonadota bacterium]